MKIRFVSVYPKGIQDVGDFVPSVGLGTKTLYQYGTSNYVTGSRLAESARETVSLPWLGMLSTLF